MTEESYSRVTYDMTIAAAQTLARLNPSMTFIYVSGAGTDSTERGRTMWARVKGKTENTLLRLPFKGAYMFRPGFIQPLPGIKSKTPSYRILYAIVKPISPLLKLFLPNQIITTEHLGRAHGPRRPKRFSETRPRSPRHQSSLASCSFCGLPSSRGPLRGKLGCLLGEAGGCLCAVFSEISDSSA
jgi:hypothetical protein